MRIKLTYLKLINSLNNCVYFSKDSPIQNNKNVYTTSDRQEQKLKSNGNQKSLPSIRSLYYPQQNSKLSIFTAQNNSDEGEKNK